jgi:tetratricopeptide (TPR) repeat protein
MRCLSIALVFCCATRIVDAQQSPDALERHLAAAQDAQAHTDCHLAASEYEAAIRLMPASGETTGQLRANLGIALYCDRQYESAVQSLHIALRLAPALSAPHLFLGLANYHLANLLGAQHELTLFLKQSPQDVTANLWLGYTFLAENEFEAAQKQFAAALQLQPSNTDAAYALGETSLELGRQSASALEKLSPDGSKLLLLASDQYRLQGDAVRADAALAEANRRSQNSPADPVTFQKEEALYEQAKAWEAQAQDAFRSILHSAPDSYRAHQIMADAFVAMQQQERAIPEYEFVIKADPTLPGVHESLAQCFVATGRFNDALAALHTEQSLSPIASARLLTRIGQVQLALGDTDGAASSLHAAIKDTQAPGQAWLLLARVLMQQKRPAESIPLLQHYLAVEPNAAAAYYQLARAYRATGDHAGMTRAMDDFKRTSEDVKARALVAPVLRGANASYQMKDTTEPPVINEP